MKTILNSLVGSTESELFLLHTYLQNPERRKEHGISDDDMALLYAEIDYRARCFLPQA